MKKRYLIRRIAADIEDVLAKGNHKDSRKAAWYAIKKGGEVIVDIQRVAARKPNWKKLDDARPFVSPEAQLLLQMRIEAIHSLKRAPHHARGFRPSRHTHVGSPRPVTALCLISGHEGQEIPGMVGYDRVVVDAEHMEQALGPATIDEILYIRKHIGEWVYISTNVSESPQLVRSFKDGGVDIRATAALTASKVIAALEAGADVVKVGFAHLDIHKRDLTSKVLPSIMKLVRRYVDQAVRERAMVMSLNRSGRFPLVSVFFPEIGIDSNGERPLEIAEKGIRLTAKAGWQGILIDTFEKTFGRRYPDFYSLADTKALADQAHKAGLELWIAGSIRQDEIKGLLRCGVDLICFGGAARHKAGIRIESSGGRVDESIKRPLVESLVREFERYDPRPARSRGPARPRARRR